jgi:hypothetical protein
MWADYAVERINNLLRNATDKVRLLVMANMSPFVRPNASLSDCGSFVLGDVVYNVALQSTSLGTP